MGLEEGGGSIAAVKNSPVDCFLARGRVPRRQAHLSGKTAWHPFRVLIFYGIRRIMGLEEGGGSIAAVKNSPVDCFLARGRVPRRQAHLSGILF